MQILYERGLVGSMEIQGRLSEQVSLFVQQMNDKKLAAEIQTAQSNVNVPVAPEMKPQPYGQNFMQQPFNPNYGP